MLNTAFPLYNEIDYEKENRILEKEDEIVSDFNNLLKEANENHTPLNHILQRKPRRKKNKVTIKKQGVSYKSVYTYEWNTLIENDKPSLYSSAFIARVQGYIRYPDNMLVINNEPPNMDKLCKLMECKRDKMTEILNELCNKDVIKKVRYGRNNYIYFNPHLITSGKSIDIETYDMFSNSRYKERNVSTW